jgi:hypothetical protein
MKINIGPYLTFWGPYQIADLLQHVGVSADRCYTIGAWLADTPLAGWCQSLHDRRHRREKIHIDHYDTWSMDATLGAIILPMLVQLQATKHGSPMVDDQDVPEHLRSTSAPALKNSWDTDDNLHARWDWVLAEMIWAFTQITHADSEAQFHTGVIDYAFVTLENGHIQMVPGAKDTHVFDSEGYQLHQDRVQRGTTLMGKYFRGLWD